MQQVGMVLAVSYLKCCFVSYHVMFSLDFSLSKLVK